MDDRLTPLEERSAWLEHRLTEVEEMLRGAFARVDALEAEVARLKEAQAQDPAEPGADWEVPPHY